MWPFMCLGSIIYKEKLKKMKCIELEMDGWKFLIYPSKFERRSTKQLLDLLWFMVSLNCFSNIYNECRKNKDIKMEIVRLELIRWEMMLFSNKDIIKC